MIQVKVGLRENEGLPDSNCEPEAVADLTAFFAVSMIQRYDEWWIELKLVKAGNEGYGTVRVKEEEVEGGELVIKVRESDAMTDRSYPKCDDLTLTRSADGPSVGQSAEELIRAGIGPEMIRFRE